MTDKKNKDQILVDKNRNGKDRRWRERKLLSLKLSDIFELLGYKETLVDRVKHCGDYLHFIKKEDGSLRLYQAYFCKNKLCPMCNWRRSIKHSYQTSRIVEQAIEQYPKGRFLFLTLTVKNVEGDKLKSTISELTEAFRRLMMYKKVKKNLLGYLRSIEVTYNEKEDNFCDSQKFTISPKKGEKITKSIRETAST